MILIPFDSARVYNILAGPGGAKYFQQFCDLQDLSQYTEDNIIDLYHDKIKAQGQDDVDKVGIHSESDGQAVGPIANNEVTLIGIFNRSFTVLVSPS
jgi:hypothetical protein